MLVNNKNFNNIKIHTQYSICEGAIKIDDLAEYCKSNKIRSVGLSDTSNLCGALEFSEKLSRWNSTNNWNSNQFLKRTILLGKFHYMQKVKRVIKI